MTASHRASYPSLFVSHGAPTLALEDCAVTQYLNRLGADLGPPKGILMVSAHFNQSQPIIASSEILGTIHDFSGFPADLYDVQYPAKGEPELALKVRDLLVEAGFSPTLDDKRGMDHGCWVPLVHMYPKADVPIVQLSISMEQSPQWHFELGQALSGLREEGVLIIGSGSASHNLHEIMMGGRDEDEPIVPWVRDFTEWVTEKIETGDYRAVLSAISDAPEGKRNHPTMDHIHPLFFALGAGSFGQVDATRGKRLHASTTYGVLAMDIYAFGSSEQISSDV
ncbi:DODA-type extradiol aromatic ring-opening family dioxygenase [Kiloniella antarctica]|uniref:DODA-type extradiol aromatic ring-opening family dioxygenase n=1 Tax=Kiloniella antarctica TaxID=1550907 RepID=A0ABW5BL92_9PROT